MVFFGEGEEDEEVCCLIMNGCKYFKVVFFFLKIWRNGGTRGRLVVLWSAV